MRKPLSPRRRLRLLRLRTSRRSSTRQTNASARLESQLEEKQADGNAIAQALIIAQRSADEILAKANNTAAETIQDAKDEAQRIIDRANNDKQDVIDAIRKLEDDREDAREEYQELLTDFINDASRKLAEIGGGSQASVAAAHYADTTDATAQVQVPMNAEPVAYSTPQTGNVAVAAATPMPSAVEKDLSGFGDADDDFSFDETRLGEYSKKRERGSSSELPLFHAPMRDLCLKVRVGR